MKAFVTGELNDIYFHETKFEGKTYDGYQVELFNPDFNSPRNRFMPFKFDTKTAEQLQLNKPEYVKQVKGKTVTIEGQLTDYNGRLTFRPTGFKVS